MSHPDQAGVGDERRSAVSGSSHLALSLDGQAVFVELTVDTRFVLHDFPFPATCRLARSFVERHAVAYDGTGNDGHAGLERYARDGSLSKTESA